MDLQELFDRGVVNPGHPPVIEKGTISAPSKALKAGTVLKLNAGKFAPAGIVDTPSAVLLEDVDAGSEDAKAFALRHGLAVRSRLLDASGDEKEASDTLAGKLPACGIYLVQAGWNESRFF